MTDVQGRCPACRGASLFLGDGGHVTCARIECPNPTAADELLHGTHDVATLTAQLRVATAELERLSAGEEPGYGPAAVPTPGQWIWRFNRASAEERLDAAKRAIENAGRASTCFTMAHEKRLAEDRKAWVTVARVRDEVDRWKRNTLEPQTMRALGDIDRVLREPAPGASAAEDFDAPWEQQDDGTWTLLVHDGGGVLSVPRQTTIGERARFAAAWAAASSRPAPGTAATQAADDSELTADEARSLVDELGTDLYRAQDALAFVGECCDIADREQRAITTADVREWLKGARCARQLAVDPPRGIRGLLEHVGIDTRGRDITVAGRVVDAARREPCPGFPDRCPNPVDVPAQSPYHGGGIRCGCGDQLKEN